MFVHGCFWHVHDCPLGRVRPKTRPEFWEAKRGRTVERDAEKEAAVRALGWRVRVVWECEIEAGGYGNALCDWIREGG